MGGGVVDGLLLDSIDVEPRVLFGVRFNPSDDGSSLAVILFSNSLELAGVMLVLLLNCGVDLDEVEVDGFDEEFDLTVDEDPVLETAAVGVCLELVCGCGVDVLAKMKNGNNKIDSGSFTTLC